MRSAFEWVPGSAKDQRHRRVPRPLLPGDFLVSSPEGRVNGPRPLLGGEAGTEVGAARAPPSPTPAEPAGAWAEWAGPGWWVERGAPAGRGSTPRKRGAGLLEGWAPGGPGGRGPAGSR